MEIIAINKSTDSDISTIIEKIKADISISFILIILRDNNILEIYTPSRIKFKLKRIFKNKIIEHTRLGLYTVYDIDVDNYNKYIIEI